MCAPVSSFACSGHFGKIVGAPLRSMMPSTQFRPLASPLQVPGGITCDLQISSVLLLTWIFVHRWPSIFVWAPFLSSSLGSLSELVCGAQHIGPEWIMA